MSEEKHEKKTVEPYIVPAKYADLRLDKMLPQAFEGATFGLVQKLCRKGAIRLDGKRVKGNEKVKKGQEIRIPATMMEQPSEERRILNLNSKERQMVDGWIMEENRNYLVLNKPYDVPVQAGSGHSKSIDRYMEAMYEGKGEAPRLIHRLDKTTTGCLVMAKTKEVAKELSREFQTRKVEKTYWAIVKGRLKEQEGKIKTSLEKEENDGFEKMEVNDKTGKRAETHFRVIESAGQYHWLEVKPKTGRTHQIRIHLSSIGVPIIGDIKYGAEKAKVEETLAEDTIFLHAREINFDLKGCRQKCEAPIPEHFKKIFKMLQWSEKDAKVDM